MRHHITDNEQLRFSTNNNAEVKDLFLSPFIGCGVATPRQFLFSPQKSDTTMQQNSQEEIWKDIPGYEGLYQASNLGRVYSLPRIAASGKPIDGKLKRTQKTRTGYLTVAMFRIGERNKKKLVHRLIAKSFIINPQNKSQVNHINGIRHDNRVENLEWTTPSENVTHSFRFLDRKIFQSKEKSLKLSKSLKKRWNTGKMSNSFLWVPIYQYTKELVFVQRFESVSSASEKTKISKASIISAARKNRKSAGGFIWTYTEIETNPEAAKKNGYSLSRLKLEE